MQKNYFITIEEVSAVTGLSKNKIKRLIQKNQFPKWQRSEDNELIWPLDTLLSWFISKYPPEVLFKIATLYYQKYIQIMMILEFLKNNSSELFPHNNSVI